MRFGAITARALQAIGRELVAARREHPFAAPATRWQNALGFASYWGFLVALVGSVVSAFGLNFNTVSGASWAGWARLGVGAVLVAEGLLLVTDWQRARRLLLGRLYRRLHAGDESAPPRLRLWLWRLFVPVLSVVGLLWVGVGSFEAAQGIRSIL